MSQYFNLSLMTKSPKTLISLTFQLILIIISQVSYSRTKYIHKKYKNPKNKYQSYKIIL